MVQTAIIAFILIGMMFFLENSGEKEEKIEHKKVESSNAIVEDEEIVSEKHHLVDEVQVEKEETPLRKIVIHKPLKIHRDMNFTQKSIVELNHIKDVELTTYYPKPKEEIEKSADVSKVVEDINTTKPTPVKEKREKIEEPVKAPEVVTPKDIEVKSATQISDSSIKDKPVISETNVTLPTVSKTQNVKITIPKVPEVKSLEEFESNSKMLKLYHKEQQLKEEAQSEVNLLKKKLTVELEKESALKAQLENINRLAKQGELQARAYEENKKEEISTLVSEKEELKSNLITHIQHEKELELKSIELKHRMANMLEIAKEATQKGEAELKAKELKISSLLSTQKSLDENLTKEDSELEKLKDELSQKELQLTSLESNLTIHTQHEKELESERIELKHRIANMLEIAKEATQKGEAELKAKELKISSLLSTQKSLDENLTKEDSELEKLKDELSQKELQLTSLESNLTIHTQHEKELESERIELKHRIANMLEIAKEATQKGEAELKAKELKISSLLSTQKSLEENLTKEDSELAKLKEELSQKELQLKSLESNLTAQNENRAVLEKDNEGLKAKIANMLIVAKEATQKGEEALKAKELKISSLLSTQKSLEENLTKEDSELAKLKEELSQKELQLTSLESNLTAQNENRAVLEKDNEGLKAKIANMLIVAKEATQKGEEELKAKESKIASLLSTQKSLEENLTKEDSELAKLKEKNLKLQTEIEQLKKVEEVKEQEVEREIKKRLTKEFSLLHVEFKINSAELTDESKKRLDEVVDVINEYKGYSYKIIGHTDNQGSEEFNIKLSKNRAESVKRYLVSKGIDENILSSEGLGSSQPITSSNTKEGREKNRRVVFEIIK